MHSTDRERERERERELHIVIGYCAYYVRLFWLLLVWRGKKSKTCTVKTIII